MPPKPRIQIPAHVFVYTIAFIPGVAYAYHWYENAPTDEELEKELRKNYTHNIDTSREKHGQMNNFLQNMKDSNSDQQRKMDQILLGGRGQQKRLYAVDEKIYGTEEGAKLQKEAQQKAMTKAKRKKKKKKKAIKESDGEESQGELGKSNLEDMQQISTVKQSVAVVAVVGALAAGASIFLGGNRSQ